jgi:hypothetical protein
MNLLSQILVAANVHSRSSRSAHVVGHTPWIKLAASDLLYLVGGELLKSGVDPHYYNEHRTHAGRQGHPPVTGVNADHSLANLS